MRILIAGVAGAVAMFIWMFIAHTVTPIGMIGFQQIPDEASVVAALHSAISKDGLYIYPWVDPKAKDMMKQYEEKAKTTGSGLVLYKAPPGSGMEMKQLVIEYVTELAMCLIAAFLLAQTMIALYAMRVGFVALVGGAAAISTNVPYWNWYGFPCDFTVAAIIMTLVGYLVAGLAIAFLIKPKAA
jgi:hypothetical protein